MNLHSVRRPAGVLAALGTLVVLTATAASAHVRVDDGSAPAQGGYGAVRLTVPTESDTASTVGVTVTFPDDVDLTSARTLPVEGWSAAVKKEGERVTQIVWQADDAKSDGIAPAEFGIFTFSAGPWPEGRDEVALPIVQSYSDGSTVPWDEVALDSGAEPEHPAPVVALSESTLDHHGAAAAHEAATHHGTTEGEAATASGSNGREFAQWVLLGLAVVLSAVAASVSISRRNSPTPVPETSRR